MKTPTQALAAVLLMAAGAGAVLWWRAVSAPAGGSEARPLPAVEARVERSVPESTAETSDQKREVADLRAKLAEMQASLNALSAARAKEAEGAAARTGTPEEMAAQERAHTQKLVDFLEGQLQREPSDREWSGPAQSEVSGMFSGGGFKASALRVTVCQTSMCRIEARHESGDAEQRFLLGLVGLKSFHDSEAFTERVEGPDGAIETRTFISRSGYRLPEPNGRR